MFKIHWNVLAVFQTYDMACGAVESRLTVPLRNILREMNLGNEFDSRFTRPYSTYVIT